MRRDIKKEEWKKPEVILMLVNDCTEGSLNSGEDYLEQS